MGKKVFEDRRVDRNLELLRKDNSRVLICNTPEAKMFAELIPNVDKVYRFLRGNVGNEKVDLEYFDSKRREILSLAEKLNSFIQEISNEKELSNINKINIEKR